MRHISTKILHKWFCLFLHWKLGLIGLSCVSQWEIHHGVAGCWLFIRTNWAHATPNSLLLKVTSIIITLAERFTYRYIKAPLHSRHKIQYQNYQSTVCALYTLKHTSRLSFGTTARSHPSSVRPAASSFLPNHHCAVASKDGLARTRTHSLKTNSDGLPLTIQNVCLLSGFLFLFLC